MPNVVDSTLTNSRVTSSPLRLRDTLYYRKSKLRERNVFALVWFWHARFEELGSQLC